MIDRTSSATIFPPTCQAVQRASANMAMPIKAWLVPHRAGMRGLQQDSGHLGIGTGRSKLGSGPSMRAFYITALPAKPEKHFRTRFGRGDGHFPEAPKPCVRILTWSSIIDALQIFRPGQRQQYPSDVHVKFLSAAKNIVSFQPERKPRTIVAGPFKGITMALSLRNEAQVYLGLFGKETRTARVAHSPVKVYQDLCCRHRFGQRRIRALFLAENGSEDCELIRTGCELVSRSFEKILV